MADILCKICGLRREEDVRLCHDLKADFTGFIFVRASPRFVDPEKAASLSPGSDAASSRTRPRRVGVFAGSPLEDVRRIARMAKLDVFQLHGGESEDYCRALGPERVIKVLWPQRCTRPELEEAMRRFAPVCSWFLLDAGTSGGGSGASLNWQSLADLHPPRPWILAGGIGAHNLEQALTACSPHGVDMNSALESTPGEKDPALVRQAMSVLRKRQSPS